MASLIKRKDSSNWIACFGRKKRATGIAHTGENAKETKENRAKAQAIADAWEVAECGDKTANQIRRVMVETFEAVTKKKLDILTPRSFSERWLASKVGNCTQSTIGFYESTMKRFLAWLEKRADLPLEEISAEDIRDFLSFRRLKVGPKTINHELKSLRTYFRAARAERKIPENPCEFIKAETVKKVQRRAFTLDEIKAILGVVDDEWRSMVLCALYTGQRLGDIAMLTWQNIDLAADQIRLVTRKTDRQILIPIAPALREHLLGISAPDNLRTPLHPKAHASMVENGRAGALSREFGEILADAGLRTAKSHKKQKDGKGRDSHHERHEVSFHTFRRTATSWLHEAGIAPAVVQQFIGHDSLDEHEKYISVGAESMRKAADAMPKV